LIVSRKILNSEDFIVGLSIFSSRGYNSYAGGAPEITVNDVYRKEKIDLEDGLFVFKVKRREKDF